MSTAKKTAVKAPAVKAPAVKAPAKSAKSKREDAVQQLFDKLTASKGKRVKYDARTHSGSGLIKDVYDGGRGAWVTVATKDRGDVTVRLTQVKLY